MAITLEQAKVGMANKVDQRVIDEFRRASFLLDQLVFDDAVSPGTGGSTLVYGYQRLKTPAKAQFRNVNEEYTKSEAIRELHTVSLKIFGGAFEVDRVIANTSGAIDEIEFQLQEKVKAAANLFHYAVINGDEEDGSFDGLNKALTNSSTEFGLDELIDLSATSAVDENYMTLLDKIDELLAEIDGVPSMIMGNAKLITKIKAVARRAGYLTPTEDAFGRQVDSYNGIPLVDLGYYVTDEGNTVPVIGIETRTIDEEPVTGLTDLYVVRIGINGFHGVTVTGSNVIRTYLPDLSQPGAVKTGEVEMIAAVALKSTRAAAVLRNIKVM